MTSFHLSLHSELSLERSILLALCSIVGSSRATMIADALKREDYTAAIDPIDPSHYENVEEFADDYLLTKVLSKSPNLPLGVDRKKVALDSFLESEEMCRLINIRFRDSSETSHPTWVFELRTRVQSILGHLTRGALDEICSSFRHGPGATTSVKGVGSILPLKYDMRLDLTANLVPFYRAILGEPWANACGTQGIVPGSRFITVPKNAKTDRGICIEPGLNMYVQLGIGTYIRNRLRRFGLNLNTQRRNQELASKAYSLRLATIDLKGASDSISWAMVKYLVGPEWAHLLGIARSPSTKVDGELRQLEKVSSMGNGFTFELESLIFFALVQQLSSNEQLSSVYGDDIIIPAVDADALIKALNYLGFSVNGSKSFLAGSFFESCGTDYFKGYPVQPFYLKGSNPGIPYSIQAANKLRLYTSQRCFGLGCDARFRPLWESLRSISPRPWRDMCVPSRLGDVGLIDFPLSETFFNRKVSGGFDRAYWIKTMKLTSVSRNYYGYGTMLESIARIRGSWNSLESHADGICFRGKYPRRGYLGKPVTRRVIVTRDDFSGLEWF